MNSGSLADDNTECPSCAKLIKPGAKFCNWCGVKFILANQQTNPAGVIIQAEQTGVQNVSQPNLKECPFCAELIKMEAVKCKHCGSALSANAMSVSKTDRLSARQQRAENSIGGTRSRPAAMQQDDLAREENERNFALFNLEFERRKKKTAIAYLLWLLLGGVGVHKFYTEQPGWGLVYIVLFLALAPLCFIFVPFIVMGIVLFIDMFTLPGQVAKCNSKLQQELMLRYRLPF